VGYAVTNVQTALRDNASLDDGSIIVTLPADTLLYLNGQATVNGILWSGAQTRLGTSYIGIVQDSAVTHITNAQAQTYIDAYAQTHATSTPTATPTVTPTPAPVTGYYITLGQVPMRAMASTYADIEVILDVDTVVYVSRQEYADGVTWHVAYYEGYTGYVRNDQLRPLTAQEAEEYLTATPEPEITATPQPYDPYADSSYGYVSASSVNFRATPTTSATRLKVLNQYAFALILGSRVVDGNTWYNINQSGTIGWVDGRYFTVLNLTELTSFLNSKEYLMGLSSTGSGSSSSSGSSGSSGSATQGQVASLEDWNIDTWQSTSAGLSASYEPFDPYTTPTAALTTETPSPEPSATFEVGTMIPITYEDESKETQADNGWLGLAIGGVILLGGAGGVYAYALNQNKKRRLAARNAAYSRRTTTQQGGQNGTGNGSGNGNNAGSSSGNATDPYTRRAVAAPPVSGTARRKDGQDANGGSAARGQNPYAKPVSGNGNPYARPTSGKTTNPYARPRSTAPTDENQSPANPYEDTGNADAGADRTNPAPHRTSRTSRYQHHDDDA